MHDFICLLCKHVFGYFCFHKNTVMISMKFLKGNLEIGSHLFCKIPFSYTTVNGKIINAVFQQILTSSFFWYNCNNKDNESAKLFTILHILIRLSRILYFLELVKSNFLESWSASSSIAVLLSIFRFQQVWVWFPKRALAIN